jgi:MFS family permease
LSQHLPATYSPQRLTRSRWGTAVVFVLLGVVQGTLAGRDAEQGQAEQPALKEYAGLTDGLLGLALLGIPAGSILAVQVTGRWIAHRGSSPVTNTSVIIMCLTAVLPAFAPGFTTLLTALVLVGIGIGLTDTAMNAHAVTVEKGYRRPIMSSFHGFASLGALLGALGSLIAAHARIGTQLQFPVVGAVTLGIALLVRTLLLPGAADAHQADESATRRTHRTPWTGTLVLLAGVALLAWMTEHAIGDWSAVYFRDHLHASGSVATYGYAAFAAFMVITRFLADKVTAVLGPRRVLRLGGLIAGLGLATGLATDTVAGSTIGCALVGVGMAGIVPIVFTAAGNQPGTTAASAVSKVAGVAFTGSLIGPPLIGLVAELTSLRTALFIVAAAAVVIGVVGPRAVRPQRA